MGKKSLRINAVKLLLSVAFYGVFPQFKLGALKVSPCEKSPVV